MLVLAPTRELAAQIFESIRVYGANKKLRSRVIFGGVGEQPQINGLRAGCDILVATPGRLLDLANRGLANLSEVRHLVLDEADRMLDMGFIHDIRRIIKLLPAKRQNLMFSATYTPDIRSLAARILVNPVQVEVTPPNSTVERVTQLAFRVRKDDKRHLLVHLFENGSNGEGRWHQALVFTRTKHGANRLSRAARARRHPLRGHPRQQEPGRAHARAGGLQGGQAHRARRDRGRLARPRHPRAAAGRQLRPAATCPRTTSIASAARRAQATTATRYRCVSEDEATLLRDIESARCAQSVPFSPTPAFARTELAPVAKRRRPAAPARHADAQRPEIPAPPPLRLTDPLDQRPRLRRPIPDGERRGQRGRGSFSRGGLARMHAGDRLALTHGGAQRQQAIEPH